MENVNDYPDAYPGEFLRVRVGSRAAGLDDETSDRDEIGIYVEPIGDVFGRNCERQSPTIRYRTAPHREDGSEGPSRPGDLDLSVVPLRRFMRLAADGNPHFLLPLFSPRSQQLISSDLGDELQALAPKIVSKLAVDPFRRYVLSYEKPDMTAKDASNMLRWACHAWDLVFLGSIRLPIRGELADLPRAVRSGKEPKESAIRIAHSALAGIDRAMETGPVTLRDEPDYPAIEQFLVRAHMRHWGAWL